MNAFNMSTYYVSWSDCVSYFQYGVSLKAEPDHKTLGFRLKGAFKDVMKEIKLLTDDQLTEFVRTGSMKVNFALFDISFIFRNFLKLLGEGLNS
jgi:hypothetical protein